MLIPLRIEMVYKAYLVKSAAACFKNKECLGMASASQPSLLNPFLLAALLYYPSQQGFAAVGSITLSALKNISCAGHLHARNALNATCAHILILALMEF